MDLLGRTRLSRLQRLQLRIPVQQSVTTRATNNNNNNNRNRMTPLIFLTLSVVLLAPSSLRPVITDNGSAGTASVCKMNATYAIICNGHQKYIIKLEAFSVIGPNGTHPQVTWKLIPKYGFYTCTDDPGVWCHGIYVVNQSFAKTSLGLIPIPGQSNDTGTGRPLYPH